MGTVAKNGRDLVRYQAVSVPSEYATQVLDKNHTGLISIQQISKDPHELILCNNNVILATLFYFKSLIFL
jgi:hypothetical protein